MTSNAGRSLRQFSKNSSETFECHVRSCRQAALAATPGVLGPAGSPGGRECAAPASGCRHDREQRAPGQARVWRLGRCAATDAQSGTGDKGRANEVLARQPRECRMRSSRRLEADPFRGAPEPRRSPRVAPGANGRSRLPEPMQGRNGRHVAIGVRSMLMQRPRTIS